MVSRPPFRLAPLVLLALSLAVALHLPQRGGPLWQVTFDKAVAGLALSPDGQTLAVSTLDRDIRFFNAHTGQQVATLAAPSDCFDLSYSRDGRRFCARGYGGLTQWDQLTGEVTCRVAGPLAAAAVTPDGRHVLGGENMADRGGRCEDYWLTGYTDGRKTWSEHGEDVCVDTLALPPEADRYLALWRSRRVARGWGLGRPDGSGKWIGPGTCRFSPDGNRIAYRHRDTAQLQLLDGRTAAPVAGPVQAPAGSGLAYSPDGERLVAYGEGLVQTYGARSLAEQGRLTLDKDYWISWFVDNRRVLSSNSKGRWLVWDAVTGQIQRQPGPSVSHQLTIFETSPTLAAFGGYTEGTPQRGELKVYSLP